MSSEKAGLTTRMHVIAQSEETQGIAPSHEHQPAEVNLSSSSGRSSDLLYQT